MNANDGIAPAHRASENLWLASGTYVLAAVIATTMNIGAQEAVRHAELTQSIWAPLAVGTCVGFVAKYWLDKTLVFADACRDAASELRKIVTYGFLSILTTLVFWGMELGFWWVWRTVEARYAGAILGLAIGYAAKFLLDRAFVFRDRPA